jgi:serine protease Do
VSVGQAAAGRPTTESVEVLPSKSILFSVPFPVHRTVPGLFLAVGILLLLVHAAFAQAPGPTLPASLERPAAAAAEERAELRRELRRNAEMLDAQATVVKIVAKLVGPAVVHVEADLPPDANSQRGRSRRVEEAGSGVIIELNDKQFVLTNRHVIRGTAPESIRIYLADGRRIHPMKDRVFEDEETDVAVMQISAPDIVTAPLGDSDRVQIGDFVLAMGSPFGLSHSVTFGIISAKGRRVLPLGEAKIRFKDFLQTDAAINPGNSGGPLVNLKGEIIGINTAIASNSGGNEGIGFAIPVNMFMIVARQLIETGKVKRGFLGITWNENFGPAMAAELGLPRPMGTRVTGVAPDSPAEAAKLQVGDVILEFDHTAIEDGAHLSNLVSLTEVGKTVPLVIFRNRKPMTVTVGVGDAANFNK